MPAEWAHQQAVWMIWPFRPDNWRGAGRVAQQAFAQVAEAIGGSTPVLMGVPAKFMEQARATMPAHVTLVEMNSDDCWARDTGPTVVTNAAGQCRGVDWGFNAWGGHKGGLYYPWDQDAEVAAQILARSNNFQESGWTAVPGWGSEKTWTLEQQVRQLRDLQVAGPNNTSVPLSGMWWQVDLRALDENGKPVDRIAVILWGQR
jgi:hypothetical protein